MQADGKILVAGNFTALNDQPRQHLGRLNGDGTVDSTFNAGVNNLPLCIAVQKDGKILLGGSFETLNGQARTNVGRLNPDGSLDSNFIWNANGVVRTLTVQSDEAVLLGGDFTTLGTASRNRLARITGDGRLDTSFDPSANGPVFALTLERDGKILAGGQFGTLLGQTHSRVGRIDSTTSPSEHLAFTGSEITWLRGGSSPAIRKATFDFATNGTSWMPLGDGGPTSVGWQLTGLEIPTNASIRAKGIVVGGRYDGSSWFVETNIGPPVYESVIIQTQPVSRTNNPKTTVLFGVQAVGGTPMSYQWFKDGNVLTNGGNILGTTSATLILNNVFGVDSGEYAVVVQNLSGSVTSSPAILKIPDPLITLNPTNRTNNAGNHSYVYRSSNRNITVDISMAQRSNRTDQWRKYFRNDIRDSEYR